MKGKRYLSKMITNIQLILQVDKFINDVYSTFGSQI